MSETNPDAFLISYIPGNDGDINSRPRPAMLVIPGGGYGGIAEREGEPIALAYLGLGYVPFILHYSVGSLAVFPTPLVEASRAMKFIRDNAARYNVDPERVFCVSFSAGGHLSASLATMWNDEAVRAAITLKDGENRPTGAVCGYAVMSYDAGLHEVFYRVIGNDHPTREEQLRWSPADRAGEDCAPMFMWHTSNDPVVPIKNVTDMCARLASLGKRFEAHIFPDGVHGLALANWVTESGNPNFVRPAAQKWVALSDEWMRGLN